MDDDFGNRLRVGKPSDQPLFGLTVLLVEDSRFACEAVRLLCQRSGARLRRADCLRSAHRHLQSYRPSVAIIDLGLPDGRGEDLIRELSMQSPRIPVILATSGTPEGRQSALQAGADGFIAKPIASMAQFQQAILGKLSGSVPRLSVIGKDDRVHPDPLALRDDLAQAAEVLRANDHAASRDDGILYLANFLTGVARIAGDGPLEDAAAEFAMQKDPARISDMIHARLAVEHSPVLR